MPPGTTFTDWQQEDHEHRLLMDEDFSWSEPPARARRGRALEPRRARSAVLEADAYAEFEAARQLWSDEYDEALRRAHRSDRDGVANHADARVIEDRSEAVDRSDAVDRSGAFDLSDPGRRTVVITGRGDDRYIPAPRQRPASTLRFHERSGFSPDRTALWAVLLGLALLIGCVAH